MTEGEQDRTCEDSWHPREARSQSDCRHECEADEEQPVLDLQTDSIDGSDLTGRFNPTNTSNKTDQSPTAGGLSVH